MNTSVTWQLSDPRIPLLKELADPLRLGVIDRLANGRASVSELANYFDLGLSNLFLPANPKLAVALNYGVAALVWYVITVVVVRLVRRLS